MEFLGSAEKGDLSRLTQALDGLGHLTTPAGEKFRRAALERIFGFEPKTPSQGEEVALAVGALVRTTAGRSDALSCEIRKLAFERGDDEMKANVMLCLTGVDTQEGWDYRRIVLERENEDLQKVAISSLAGISNEEANEIRSRYVNRPKFASAVLGSLISLDTPLSWEIRETMLARGSQDRNIANDVIASLRKVPTKRAVSMIKSVLETMPFTEAPEIYHTVAETIVGIPYWTAAEVRNKLEWAEVRSQQTGEKDLALESIVGDDSVAALKLRKIRMLDLDDAKRSSPELAINIANALSKSLMGIDTPEAWDIRESILKDIPAILNRADRKEHILAELSELASHLAGLTSAKSWQMRRKLMSLGVPFDEMVFSLTNKHSFLIAPIK